MVGFQARVLQVGKVWETGWLAEAVPILQTVCSIPKSGPHIAGFFNTPTWLTTERQQEAHLNAIAAQIL